MQEKKDIKLFYSLLFWSIIPSVYQLLRMRIIVSSSVDINILGQLEWYDLFNETIEVTLTVPLYFLLKLEKNGKPERNGTAFLLAMGIYIIFTSIVYTQASKLTVLMHAEEAAGYLKIETISMAVDFINVFLIMIYTLNNKDTFICNLLFLKIGMLICCDFVIIPLYKENGVAYSTLFVNSAISIISILMAVKMGLIKFPTKIKYDWIGQWAKLGFFAGFQIFLDNFIYAVMVCRMVNQVGETGNYWVANNFIYGWLLVPVFQISEIIKKNKLEKIKFRNVWKYGIYIIIGWVITMPLWKPFLRYGMGIFDAGVSKIVYRMMSFYLLFLFSSFADGWFISLGKNYLVMINSIIVNVIYYGIIYILFTKSFFNLDINFVMNMFGGGMLVHFIVSMTFLWRVNHKSNW